jgi:ABC-2 type transport system permease protein
LDLASRSVKKLKIANVLNLGIKELYSLKADPTLLVLIVYIFTFSVYSVAKGANYEVVNASVAILDEDHSPLSRQITSALLPPTFLPPVEIPSSDMEEVLNNGNFVFVLVFPPNFGRDVLQGKQPEVQLNVDASAMTMAGNGAVYIQEIVLAETIQYLTPNKNFQASLPIKISIRKLFNPNSSSFWFNAVMQIINSITLLGIILPGAALIRERERGTIEHLLSMPITSAEIMFAKIWSNGLIVLIATALSLQFVVRELLSIPIHGSITLFILASALYLFSVTSLGILLGTITRSMAQFGLLVIPIIIVMYLLSGSTTPQESMPEGLRWIMQLSPSTHFVALSQDILYRGAGFLAIWPLLLVLIAIGGVFFTISLNRFRRTIATMA